MQSNKEFKDENTAPDTITTGNNLFSKEVSNHTTTNDKSMIA